MLELRSIIIKPWTQIYPKQHLYMNPLSIYASAYNEQDSIFGAQRGHFFFWGGANFQVRIQIPATARLGPLPRKSSWAQEYEPLSELLLSPLITPTIVRFITPFQEFRLQLIYYINHYTGVVVNQDFVLRDEHVGPGVWD